MKNIEFPIAENLDFGLSVENITVALRLPVTAEAI